MKRLILIIMAILPLTITAHITGYSHMDWQHSGLDIEGAPTQLTGFTVYCGRESGVYTLNQAIHDSAARSMPLADLGLSVITHYEQSLHIDGTPEQIAAAQALAASFDFAAGVFSDRTRVYEQAVQAHLDAVQAGTRTQPTVDELIAELPVRA